LPAVAFGHGIPASLDQWGDFGKSAAACQRAIGRAAAHCASTAVHYRNRCLGAEVTGETCDRQAIEDASIAARLRAVALIERYCTSTDLQNLNFIDLSDVLIDVAQTCRATDRAATSAVWAPVMAGDSVGAAGPTEAR